MLPVRELVMPLLVALMVGILVWAYLDRRLQNALGGSNARLLVHQSAHHMR